MFKKLQCNSIKSNSRTSQFKLNIQQNHYFGPVKSQLHLVTKLFTLRLAALSLSENRYHLLKQINVSLIVAY